MRFVTTKSHKHRKFQFRKLFQWTFLGATLSLFHGCYSLPYKIEEVSTVHLRVHLVTAPFAQVAEVRIDQETFTSNTLDKTVNKRSTPTISFTPNEFTQLVRVYNQKGELLPQNEDLTYSIKIDTKDEEVTAHFVNSTFCSADSWCPMFLNNDLKSIWSPNGQNLYVLGQQGLLLHSNNQGQIWERVHRSVGSNLTALSGSVDGKTLVAVGLNGTILHSQDEGKTWQPREFPPDAMMNPDKQNLRDILGGRKTQTFVAVGDNGVVLRSTDNGVKWARVDLKTSKHLVSIAGSADGETLFVLGVNLVAVSKDAGSSWSIINQNTELHNPSDIFVDTTGQRAIVVSGRRAFSSSSSSDYKIIDSPSDLSAISGSADFQILVAIGGSYIAHSGSSGFGWEQSTSTGSPNNLLDIFSDTNARVLVAVGENGTIVQSTNTGDTWNIKTSGTRLHLSGFSRSEDGQNLFAIGLNGTLIRSDNAGQSWAPIKIENVSNNLLSLFSSEDKKLFVTVGTKGFIARSTDGGTKWKIPASGKSEDITSIAGSSNGQTLVAIVRDGTLVRSVDYGERWDSHPIASATTYVFHHIYVSANGQIMMAVGNQGVSAYSTNAGQSWQIQKSTLSTDLWSVTSLDQGKTFVAVGSNGTIVRSIDNGQSWEPKSSNVQNVTLTKIAHSNDEKALIAVGEKGTIVQSNDGGETWAQQSSGTDEKLVDIEFSNRGQEVCVVGENGTFLCRY